MGDSDDDWFKKDIDEFVVQAPQNEVEHIVTTKIPNVDTTTPTNIAYIDSGLSAI